MRRPTITISNVPSAACVNPEPEHFLNMCSGCCVSPLWSRACSDDVFGQLRVEALSPNTLGQMVMVVVVVMMMMMVNPRKPLRIPPLSPHPSKRQPSRTLDAIPWHLAPTTTTTYYIIVVVL